MVGAVILVAGFIALFGIPWVLSSREVFLIPNGYVGPVVVVWDHPDGQPLDRHGFWTYHYKFDSSGVVLVREPRPLDRTRMTLMSYYYIDAAGQWHEIPNSRDQLSRPGDSPIAHAATFGGGYMRDAREVSWQYLCVGPAAPGNACGGFRGDNIDKLLSSVGVQASFPWDPRLHEDKADDDASNTTDAADEPRKGISDE